MADRPNAVLGEPADATACSFCNGPLIVRDIGGLSAAVCENAACENNYLPRADAPHGEPPRCRDCSGKMVAMQGGFGCVRCIGDSALRGKLPRSPSVGTPEPDSREWTEGDFAHLPGWNDRRELAELRSRCKAMQAVVDAATELCNGRAGVRPLHKAAMAYHASQESR